MQLDLLGMVEFYILYLQIKLSLNKYTLESSKVQITNCITVSKFSCCKKLATLEPSMALGCLLLFCGMFISEKIMEFNFWTDTKFEFMLSKSCHKKKK